MTKPTTHAVLDPAKAKRVEVKKVSGNNASAGRPYKIYVFDCICGCGNEIRVQPGRLSTASGKCMECAKPNWKKHK